MDRLVNGKEVEERQAERKETGRRDFECACKRKILFKIVFF